MKKINQFISKNPEKIILSILFGSAAFEIYRIYKDFPVYWSLNALKSYDSILYFLPQSISSNIWTFHVLAAIFILSLLSFFLTSWRKTSFSLNFISFFLIISFYLRHISFTDHRAGVPTFFYFICLVPIMLDEKRWSDFVWKSLFVGVVTFYFLTGLHKLIASGPTWANGTSLQLWFHYDSVSAKEIVWPIMRNVKLAKKIQAIILFLEFASPLALTKTFRSAWLLGIITFHVGLEITFGYQYFFVGILTAMTTYIVITKSLSYFTFPNKSSAKTLGKSLKT